jgi:amino acid adenylation domain-containing protein
MATTAEPVLGPPPAPPRDESWHSVIERFERAAAAHPDRPALAFGDSVLTYGELEARTAAVAAGLAGRGAGPETLVGLLLPRGLDLVLGLLGALRCGAGYLPLDPALPLARLTGMCDQADPVLLLSDAAHRRRFGPAPARRIVTVETCGRDAAAGFQRPWIRPGQAAYAIFTSGSTGRPKGVLATHGSLAALLAALETVAGPAPARVGWNASASFDASVQQWLRLCRGDTVVLVGAEDRADPQRLAALAARERLDELDITPSHLVVLLEHLGGSRTGRPLKLLIGGEAIAPGLWDRLVAARSAGRLDPVNLYGPTECTVDATSTPVASPASGPAGPHLGDPLPGTRVYVLDETLRPVPEGAAGELYLAGRGVSRGYLGQPGLTAQRFVADCVTGDGGRMYRTGDRAALGPNGRLEYLGRTDDQVKLRGYRIELGEIEAVLSRCPGVTQAAAVIREDMPGGAGLVGYCRTAGGEAEPWDPEAVRHAAAAALPDYMVPAVLVEIESFPLTLSGKVDRAALPAPHRAGSGDKAPPATPTEEMLAALWREVLGVDAVGAEDDFFALGGQSLLAIRLVARLRRETRRSVPLVAVFQNPVLRRFAAYLDAR